jgi:hypothetical protein
LSHSTSVPEDESFSNSSSSDDAKGASDIEKVSMHILGFFLKDLILTGGRREAVFSLCNNFCCLGFFFLCHNSML